MEHPDKELSADHLLRLLHAFGRTRQRQLQTRLRQLVNVLDNLAEDVEANRRTDDDVAALLHEYALYAEETSYYT
jgi:hypothetical protein